MRILHTSSCIQNIHIRNRNEIFSFQLLHRLKFFRVGFDVPLIILRHKAVDVDLANCPSTIDPNLCIKGNDSAILLCSDDLNKVSILINPKDKLNVTSIFDTKQNYIYLRYFQAISYSEKVVDAYWSAFETPKDVYCGKYDDFLYGTN